MNTHVKIVGWLSIVSGVLTILTAVIGLVALNLRGDIPNPRDAMLVTAGSVCFFLPVIIASFAAGFGLLNLENWARVVAIVLAILSLVLFPIGALIGGYTLWVMFNDETKALFVARS